MGPKVRVLVVDGHHFMREGLRSYFRNHDQFEIVGEAVDGVEALSKARQLRPDVVVMEVKLPILDGLETTKRLVQLMPAVRVLLLTHDHHDQVVQSALDAGAFGFVVKEASRADFVEALNGVSRGRRCFPSHRLSCLKPRTTDRDARVHLTERESEVLRLLVEGLCNSKIAERLGISVRTVDKHRENILRTLGMRNMADLVRFAASNEKAKIGQ